MQSVLNSSPVIQGYLPFKGISNTFRENKDKMPNGPEFKTKLKFDPSKLSTAILKKYLYDILHNTEPEQLLSGDVPPQYTKDPDNMTDYRVLKELGLMSVKEWKGKLESSGNDVEQLYLHDDVMALDSRYYYEKWKTVQEEVGNHEKQMSFFRLVSEIVSNLGNRNFVEIDQDGEQHTLTSAEQDSMHIVTGIANNNKNILETMSRFSDSTSSTTGSLVMNNGHQSIPVGHKVQMKESEDDEVPPLSSPASYNNSKKQISTVGAVTSPVVSDFFSSNSIIVGGCLSTPLEPSKSEVSSTKSDTQSEIQMEDVVDKPIDDVNFFSGGLSDDEDDYASGNLRFCGEKLY